MHWPLLRNANVLVCIVLIYFKLCSKCDTNKVATQKENLSKGTKVLLLKGVMLILHSSHCDSLG